MHLLGAVDEEAALASEALLLLMLIHNVCGDHQWYAIEVKLHCGLQQVRIDCMDRYVHLHVGVEGRGATQVLRLRGAEDRCRAHTARLLV